jgi:LPS-assembly lipoprotein
LLFLLCLAALNACGFHLRGSSQIADKYNPLNLQANGLTDQQLRLLKQALQNAGATLTDSQQARQLRVSISQSKNQKLTSSSSAVVELIQVSMQLKFSLQDEQGNMLVQAQEINQNKTLELNSENVLSQQDSIDAAVRELEKDLIRSMIYRLQK